MTIFCFSRSYSFLFSYLCSQIIYIMQTIQVKDKSFSLFIPEKEILKEVKRIAAQINRDYAGKEPVFEHNG